MGDPLYFRSGHGSINMPIVTLTTAHAKGCRRHDMYSGGIDLVQVRRQVGEFDRDNVVVHKPQRVRCPSVLPPTNLIKNEWGQKSGQTLYCRKGGHGFPLLGVVDVFGDGGADDGHRQPTDDAEPWANKKRAAVRYTCAMKAAPPDEAR